MALDDQSVFGDVLFGARHYLGRRFGYPGHFFRLAEPPSSPDSSRRQILPVVLVQVATIKNYRWMHPLWRRDFSSRMDDLAFQGPGSSAGASYTWRGFSGQRPCRLVQTLLSRYNPIFIFQKEEMHHVS